MEDVIELASETNPHPAIPDGPWQHFADCTTCGAHRGFGCVDVELRGTRVPDTLLGYAHPARRSDYKAHIDNDLWRTHDGMSLAEIAAELGISVTMLLEFDQSLCDRPDVRQALDDSAWAAVSACVIDDAEAYALIDAYRQTGEIL